MEVRAYRRSYHRRRYRRACPCEGHNGTITAPPPDESIPKGTPGISIRVEVLLDEYPLFEPAYQASIEHNQGQVHWHADETR